jgi:glucose/arabinose dehydrogenase/plastocyanin
MSRLCVVVMFVVSVLVLAPLPMARSVGFAQEDAAVDSHAGGPTLLGGDLPGDPQIQFIQVATGLQMPVNVAFPPDGSGRMFVVEVGGTIRVVNPDGTILPEPFLDLTSTVAVRPGQQGLLGLAFHPNFAENGRFFVDYNNLYANGQITVSEFMASEDDPNIADKKTERPLLTIDKPYPQHNGGTLRFGPDGFLYISTGDGGWQGDPYDNAQNRFSLLGKILRIDVDSSATGQPYGIPADNPFAGPGRYDSPYPGEPPQGRDSGNRRHERNKNIPNSVSAENRKNRSPVRPEIWAYGFRNPWQFSFDPETGDFYVGDVGGDNWEEIDFQEAGTIAGQNYGWDWLEGSHCYPAGIEECPRQQVGVLPVAQYAHGDDGCAVIGLGVYRGEAYPSLDGIYFSGEFCTGEIRGLQRDGDGNWQFQNLLDSALQITGSGQDESGVLYVAAVTSQRESANGSVWKLVSADQVPAGATTVPLGEPSQGDAEVDEFGAPVAEAGDESNAAGETAEPVNEEAPVDETVTPGEQTAAATPISEPATGESATADSKSAQVSGGVDEIVIGMYDIYFEPDRIHIPANTDVRFIFENRGAAPHNFELKEGDISVDVAPGESAETVINLPPGTYKFICNVPGHKQVGMNGAIVVD